MFTFKGVEYDTGYYFCTHCGRQNSFPGKFTEGYKVRCLYCLKFFVVVLTDRMGDNA